MVSTEGPLNPDKAEYDPAKTRVDLQVPEGLSIAETEDWVSGDAERAKAALSVENARGDDVRSTLVTKLEALVNDNLPGSITSPQVSPAITPGAEGTV